MTNKVTLSSEEKSAVRKTFWYSLGTYVGGNKVVQQGKCVAMSMLPGLKTFYKDEPEKVKEYFKAHANEYFNTNYTINGLCMGTLMALEKERADEGSVDQSTISNVKASLMGPTAAIGDSVMYNIIRPIVAGIAMSFAAQGSPFGALLFVLLYGFGGWILSYLGVKFGYTNGLGFIQNAVKKGSVALFTEAAGIVGAMMVGVLVANNVKFSFGLTTQIGELTVGLQSVLDSIFPGIMNLVWWYGAFKALQKGVKPTKLMFIIMGICIVLALFKIV